MILPVETLSPAGQTTHNKRPLPSHQSLAIGIQLSLFITSTCGRKLELLTIWPCLLRQLNSYFLILQFIMTKHSNVWIWWQVKDAVWTRRNEWCVWFLVLNVAYIRNCRGLPGVHRIALDIRISRSNRTETVSCRCLIKNTRSVPNIFFRPLRFYLMLKV